MELRHLRYFCAIVEDMHVTRAAERLHIAQPALTQQIKSLENELGTALLRRTGRRIELTLAGAVFAGEARVILERVRTASLLAIEAARGGMGSISIGLTESSAFSTGVTSILKRFKKQWPSVNVTLVQRRTPDLLAALRERHIDAAFVRPPLDDVSTMEQIRLFSEPIMAVVPKSHRLAKKRRVTIGDLSKEPIILSGGRARPSTLELAFRGACSQAGFTPNIVQWTPELTMAVNFVAAGFGISLVPMSLRGVRAAEVVYLPFITNPPLVAEIILAFHADCSSPAVENLKATAILAR
jgi:DNA-binding transcriptional LysR family regulator